jgi:hypothetical protein
VIILAVLLALSAQAFRQPHQASADGGPFPTHTPTRTPTTEPTRTPTTTPTNIPIATLSGNEAQQALNQPNPTEPTQTPTSRASGISGCWPFGLLILLVMIVLVAYLFTRRTRSDQNE